LKIPDTVKKQIGYSSGQMDRAGFGIGAERKPEPLPEAAPLPPVAAATSASGESVVVKH